MDHLPNIQEFFDRRGIELLDTTGEWPLSYSELVVGDHQGMRQVGPHIIMPELYRYAGYHHYYTVLFGKLGWWALKEITPEHFKEERGWYQRAINHVAAYEVAYYLIEFFGVPTTAVVHSIAETREYQRKKGELGAVSTQPLVIRLVRFILDVP